MSDLPVRDKVAFVFHGIVGGTSGRNGAGDPCDIGLCSKFVKHHLVGYEVDFFVHSWSHMWQDPVVSLYEPKGYLFEPQEMFGFALDGESLVDEDRTHQFRTVSRYNSFERAVKLKRNFEEANGFKYRWVVVLRLDLVMFRRIEFRDLDPNCFYIPYEPHWPWALDDNPQQLLHDVLFFSSSENIDRYATITTDMRSGKFDPILHMPHVMAYHKLREMFPGMAGVRYGAKRYEDFEIYRFVVRPDLNPIGHQYGALDMRRKMDELSKMIG